jgi:host factor-I protein
MEKAGNGAQNLQDEFLYTLRKEHQTITIYLMNGYKLSGKIKGFDNNGQEIMIFKHAISTIGTGPTVARKESREGPRE